MSVCFMAEPGGYYFYSSGADVRDALDIFCPVHGTSHYTFAVVVGRYNRCAAASLLLSWETYHDHAPATNKVVNNINNNQVLLQSRQYHSRGRLLFALTVGIGTRILWINSANVHGTSLQHTFRTLSRHRGHSIITEKYHIHSFIHLTPNKRKDNWTKSQCLTMDQQEGSTE